MKAVLLIPKNFNYFTQLFYQACIEHRSLDIVGTLVDERIPLSFKKKVFINLKRGRGGYMLVMLLKKILSKIGAKSRSIQSVAIKRESAFPCDDINSESSIEVIKALDPDIIILVGGFGILKEGVLNIPKLGAYSFHHGDMRTYRGMPLGFWEIYNGEKSMGITFQKLDKKLDAGIPVAETNVVFGKKSYEEVKLECYQKSIPIFNKAITNLAKEPSKKYTELDKLGRLYSLPNLSEWLKFNFVNFKRVWLGNK